MRHPVLLEAFGLILQVWRTENAMRIVGNRRPPQVGMRMPTQAEIDASVEASQGAPRVIPKGVYRYRSHTEANADTDRWTADGMVARAVELVEARQIRG